MNVKSEFVLGKKLEVVTKEEASAIYKSKLSGNVLTLVKPPPAQDTKVVTNDGLIFIDKLRLFKNQILYWMACI